MITGSLRIRLLGLAALTIAIALMLAWLALTVLFERHVRSRVEAELANHIVWLAANLTEDGGDLALTTAPADPRFQRPLGGLYWQIEEDEGPPLRSRSLWDETLPAPPTDSTGVVSFDAEGPQGQPLLVRGENLTLSLPGADREMRILVAADYDEIAGPVAAFGRDLAVALAIIGICLAAAAALQVAIGLRPLGNLAGEVAAIRAGKKARLEPHVPTEVQPLVEEVNELLALQEHALTRARAQAADLAHGLKTPLTVLTAIARGLQRAGHEADAGEILAQVQMLARRVDRQLARARLGTGRLATSNPAKLIERLAELLRRTPQGEHLDWHVRVDPEIRLRIDEVDLAEAVGNLLDNAVKWARSRVQVTLEQRPKGATLRVDDDGPGVPGEQLAEVVTRGARLDRTGEGAGLGLAIVHDIVGAYKGIFELSRSELGGLCARIIWPSLPTENEPIAIQAVDREMAEEKHGVDADRVGGHDAERRADAAAVCNRGRV